MDAEERRLPEATAHASFCLVDLPPTGFPTIVKSLPQQTPHQVQLGAVSGCSLFASTLGFGSLMMFFNWRLIHSSIGKL